MSTIPSVLPTKPGVLSTEPSAVSTEPSVLSTEPSAVSTEPSVLSTQSSMLSTEPSVLSTKPCVLPTEPSVLFTNPSVLAIKPLLPHSILYWLRKVSRLVNRSLPSPNSIYPSYNDFQFLLVCLVLRVNLEFFLRLSKWIQCDNECLSNDIINTCLLCPHPIGVLIGSLFINTSLCHVIIRS